LHCTVLYCTVLCCTVVVLDFSALIPSIGPVQPPSVLAIAQHTACSYMALKS
jgi:hypothetical protein